MLEVEAKIRLDDVGEMRARLLALGAERGDSVVERDVFFQHPQRDFVETDEALRLRDVNGVLELTYKGPNQSTDLKIREEHNVPLGADPCALLAALGFVEAARLEKNREFWALEGATLTIDALGFGSFLEVEALGESKADASALVESILASLNLADAPRISESYLCLAERHRAG